MHSTIKCLQLLVVGHSAGDEALTQSGSFGDWAKGVADLHCKLTGGNQDQAEWLTRLGRGA